MPFLHAFFLKKRKIESRLWPCLGTQALFHGFQNEEVRQNEPRCQGGQEASREG